MKKILAVLLSLALFTTSCKKDGSVPEPQGNTPSQAVGQWMYGSFSMSEFWSYDGRYQGKPFELAVMFHFKSNGTYEKYFVASTRDYSGCQTQAFSSEKGRVKFDEDNGSFTTTPSEGTYRGFYSCAPNRNINRKMASSELKSTTYFYRMVKGSNGKTNMEVRFQETDQNVSTFLPTAW
ncbi:hypothetical protein [Tellurirhabdus rosea]|uniref:hypothetical protein n=1 Tax=Tellurirhabdus rosea TaxID=2674997 RepID=UPI0022564903|nr:hypothetical protein [Tellurirhabdus rosea]